MPVFSIITVVFNSEKFIERTIKSVINQTHRNLIEYIIIDGNSNDGTRQIISKYDENIDIVISENDKGIYDAMNKGIQQAHGEFIWFINSGDEINDLDVVGKIGSLTKNADILYGETNYVDDQRSVLGTRSALTTRKLPTHLSVSSFLKGMVVSHQSIIIKRTIASSFDLQYKCSADINWCIECLKRSKNTVCSNLTLSKYLVAGFSSVNKKRCWKERWRIYVLHYGLFKTIGAHFDILLNNARQKALGNQTMN